MRPTVPGEHLGFWSGEFKDSDREHQFRSREDDGREWALLIASIWLISDTIPVIFVHSTEIGWGMSMYAFITLRSCVSISAAFLAIAAWRRADYRIINNRTLIMLVLVELSSGVIVFMADAVSPQAAVSHMTVVAAGFFFAPFTFRLRLFVSGVFLAAVLCRFGADAFAGSMTTSFLIYWTIASSVMAMIASRMFRAHKRTVYLYRMAEREHIRRLRIARDDAAAANEMKTDFVAATAHDLRNPLNAVIGFSEIIEAQLFGPNRMDKYREAAIDINTCARQMLHQIESLLDAAVLEARPQQLKLEPVRLAGLAETVARQARASSRKKGLVFEVQVDRDLPPILADENALHQILANLVANAQKFTPDGGRVSIDVVTAGNETAIRVLDTGAGIPEHKRKRAKARFATAISGRPPMDEQGWGLGLSIVDSLAKAHGGRLELEPNIPKGTIASIVIPQGIRQRQPSLH